MLEGTNAFGATLRVPRVVATKVEPVSREDVLAPALKKYEVNRPVGQHGLVITLNRIELAERETRVYVKAVNQSPEKASVTTYGAKIVQGSRQLERKSVFDSNYPDMPGDLLAGVEAEAVIMFDALNPSEPLRFVWDGPRLSNFCLTFRPYEWTVGLQ
jgi:hypothetical protein